MVSLTKLALLATSIAALAHAGRPAGQRSHRRAAMMQVRGSDSGSDSGSGSGSGSASSSGSSTSGSGSGKGSSGGSFSGRATFFSVGLGACGWNSKPTDLVVAIPSSQYGNTGGKSSWCGKQLKITNQKTHKTVTATAVDACPSCSSGDLDMSHSLFGALSDNNYNEGEFQMSWTIA